MLTVFFNHEGIVHLEYAAAGQTVNKGTWWRGTGFKTWRRYKKRNDAAVGNSKESVAKVLWTMEGLLEQGCGVQRGLL